MWSRAPASVALGLATLAASLLAVPAASGAAVNRSVHLRAGAQRSLVEVAGEAAHSGAPADEAQGKAACMRERCPQEDPECVKAAEATCEKEQQDRERDVVLGAITTRETEQLVCMTTSGEPCAFPFEYNSGTYSSCSSVDSVQEWCYTDYARTSWDYCDLANPACTLEKENGSMTPKVESFEECVVRAGCTPSNETCLKRASLGCVPPEEVMDTCIEALGLPVTCPATQEQPFFPFLFTRLLPFPIFTVSVFVLFLVVFAIHKVLEKQQGDQRRHSVDNANAQSLATAVGKYFLPSECVNAHQFRGMTPAETKVSIKFEELGLRLKDGRSVLQGVSGEFEAGHMVAIMGPSGCGKTTFMNVLAGRATYGTQTGKVWFNGTEVDPVKLRPSFGFVPQDDVVHPRLTVRENLLFQAQLRNPGNTPQIVINDIVDDALAVLQISHIQSSLVGDVSERGISGGQKKRVNIGWELVAQPTLLYLDEPTSGLDATTSLQIINSLRKMTELNMTICMVIHQPRYQLFTLFDDVLLLGPGGRTVFLGPSQRTKSYFEGLGFVMPEGENTADWFMDVLSGSAPHPTITDFKPAVLFDKWTENKGSLPSKCPRRQVSVFEKNFIAEGALREEWSKVDVDESGYLDQNELKLLLERCGVRSPDAAGVEDLFKRISPDNKRVLFEDLLGYIVSLTSVVAQDHEVSRNHTGSGSQLLGKLKGSSDAQPLLSSGEGGLPALQRPNMFLQMKTMLVRRLSQFFRESRQRLVDLGLITVCAMVVGFLHKGKLVVGGLEISGMLMMFHTGLALLTAVSSLKVFGNDREIFWRESGSGMSVLSHMLAKVLGNLFDLLFQCSLYTLVYFLDVRPAGEYWMYWVPCALVALVSASWAYFISSILPPQNAMTGTVIIILILGPILGNPQKWLDRLDGGATEVMIFPSIIRWSASMTFMEEMAFAEDQGWCTHGLNQQLVERFQSPDRIAPLISAWNAGALTLLLMSFWLHVFCYLGLKYTNRGKQV